MTESILTLKRLHQNYAVCRLDSDASIPDWAAGSGFYSITRTAEELSVVCLQHLVPNGVKAEKNFRILKIEGPLDFSLTGILSTISSVLARNKISIFAVSTFDTDYILVREADVDSAVAALTGNGCRILDEDRE